MTSSRGLRAQPQNTDFLYSYQEGTVAILECVQCSDMLWTSRSACLEPAPLRHPLTQCVTQGHLWLPNNDRPRQAGRQAASADRELRHVPGRSPPLVGPEMPLPCAGTALATGWVSK